MNKLLLTGNLTADARINAAGDKFDAVSFTIACNDGYKDASGAWVETPEFIDCTRFVSKGNGTKLVEMLTKGREVEVEGALVTSKPREGTDGKTYVNKFCRVDDLKPGRKPAPKEAAAE